MESKKASELYKILVQSSQKAMISEDTNLFHAIGQIFEKDEVNKDFIEIIRINNEYLRASFAKTTIITLIELGIIDGDVDILDTMVSNHLLLDAVGKNSNNLEEVNKVKEN